MNQDEPKTDEKPQIAVLPGSGALKVLPPPDATQRYRRVMEDPRYEVCVVDPRPAKNGRNTWEPDIKGRFYTPQEAIRCAMRERTEGSHVGEVLAWDRRTGKPLSF